MQIFLTKRQTELLIGSILGDGGIYPSTGNDKVCSYYVKQSAKYQNYIFWLYREFESICFSAPKQRKDNKQCYFRSRYLENLVIWRKKFYPNGIKIIPEDIGELFSSPLSLAIWYMDDGTLDYRPHNHCSFLLSTHCFSDKGVQKLLQVLKKNFGIDATMYHDRIRGVSYPRIYIGAKGRDKFIETVSPFILDCFKYKLPQYRQPLRDFSRIRFTTK